MNVTISNTQGIRRLIDESSIFTDEQLTSAGELRTRFARQAVQIDLW